MGIICFYVNFVCWGIDNRRLKRFIIFFLEKELKCNLRLILIIFYIWFRFFYYVEI